MAEGEYRMTQLTKRSWHWFILQSDDDTDFGIGALLDRVFKDATGATIYEVVPVNPLPEPPSPPIPVPLWRGTAIMALTIRDDKGVNMGLLANGAAVDVWAGPLDIGGYEDRLIVSAPGQVRRNVWAEGVRRV